jgi:hypothetical protein
LLRPRLVSDLRRLVCALIQPRDQNRRLLRVERNVDGPVFLLLERANLTLAFNNQPQRDGLHAPCR